MEFISLLKEKSVQNEDVLKKDLGKLVKLLKDFYKDNLIAIILFGSLPKGEWTLSSDIDILIVLKDAPSGLKRYKNILDVVSCHDLKYNYDITILPLSAFKFPRGILFDIAKTGISLYDTTFIFDKMKERVEYLQNKGAIEEKTSNGFTYWRIHDAGEISGGLL